MEGRRRKRCYYKTKVDTGSVNIDANDTKLRTALMIATHQQNNEAAKALIDAGANVNALDDMHDSPFLYAGASGYAQIVSYCLQRGADFTVFNRYNGTALIPACEREHVEIVKELLKQKDFPIDPIASASIGQVHKGLTYLPFNLIIRNSFRWDSCSNKNSIPRSCHEYLLRY